ncbi:MAG: hypothetical protein QOF81_771 [Acidimicrobiaceae bacterium]|nr:hypothetical protein [Acidimicrobiaceae bacterium]
MPGGPRLTTTTDAAYGRGVGVLGGTTAAVVGPPAGTDVVVETNGRSAVVVSLGGTLADVTLGVGTVVVVLLGAMVVRGAAVVGGRITAGAGP